MTEWAELEQDVIPTKELGRLEALLTEEFSPPLQRSTVQRCLLEALAKFADASVRTYLTILVERTARIRLEQLVGEHEARRAAAAARRLPVVPVAPPDRLEGIRPGRPQPVLRRAAAAAATQVADLARRAGVAELADTKEHTS